MTERREEDPSKLPALARLFLWTDRPSAVNKLVYGIYALCAGLFAADFLYHKHTYVGVEGFPGFYAIYGFVMCAGLVICARGMRVVLMRDEKYYAPKDVESEPYPEDQLDRVEHDV